ncbi:hypothetical protein [Nocardia rhamnosiphila]
MLAWSGIFRHVAGVISGPGEAVGRCFWVSDGLIVRVASISNMTQVLVGLVESGGFTQVASAARRLTASRSHPNLILK